MEFNVTPIDLGYTPTGPAFTVNCTPDMLADALRERHLSPLCVQASRPITGGPFELTMSVFLNGSTAVLDDVTGYSVPGGMLVRLKGLFRKVYRVRTEPDEDTGGTLITVTYGAPGQFKTVLEFTTPAQVDASLIGEGDTLVLSYPPAS